MSIQPNLQDGPQAQRLSASKNQRFAITLLVSFFVPHLRILRTRLSYPAYSVQGAQRGIRVFPFNASHQRFTAMRSGSSPSMHRLLRILSITLIATSALAPFAAGQAAPAASGAPALSRVDLFGGYAYFKPFNSDIGNVDYPAIPFGADGSVAAYFTRHFGLQAEGNYSPNGPSDNNCAYTAQAGPIVRFSAGRVVPFAHLLGGGAIVGGPRAQTCNTWGYGGTVGGGLDYILPAFHDHIALRPIQADFLYAHIDNGPIAAGGFYGGIGQITAVRASAGIVFRFGNMNPGGSEPPTFNCSAEPAQVFPGDPVTLTASTLNLNPKQKPKYIWTSSGGKASGEGSSAGIDTVGMQPGVYQVSGQLVEGTKERLVASCTTSFTVRAYQPPTIACSASRSAINSGDQVAIKASATSPQNRPLTYSYGTTAGSIVGEGPVASLSTTGVSPGNITVTCNVVDDKGQAASNTVSLVVAIPPPPPVVEVVKPTMQSLCSITFDRDRKRPDRVDNEAKGCLDDVALTLNRDAASKLLIVGSHADKETNSDSAIRAMNAAEYLTREKGVDPSRLDLRIGPDNSRSVAMMLVPPGAAVDASGATSFDTSSVKRTGPAYGKPGEARPKRKPAVKKPAPKKATAAQF